MCVVTGLNQQLAQRRTYDDKPRHGEVAPFIPPGILDSKNAVAPLSNQFTRPPRPGGHLFSESADSCAPCRPPDCGPLIIRPTPPKNALVPRFFLTFSLLEVP